MAVKVKNNSKVKTRKKKDDMRDKIKKLIDQIEQTWIEVSILLADVYENEKYVEWGYEKFEDYAQEELKLEYRAAMYRVQLGRLINETGIDKNKLKDFGWTKVREMLGLLKDMDKEEAEKLLDSVKDLSVRETKEFVKRARKEIVSAENVEELKKTTLKFTLKQDQADIVLLALEKAKEIAKTDNNSLALEYICGEWLETFEDNPSMNTEDEEDEEEIELE